MKTFFLTLMLALTSAVPSAIAQTPTPSPTPNGEATTIDENFLVAATQLNNNEIALSQLALRRSNNPRVRAFAVQMIRDHTRAGRQVDDLVETLDTQVEMPTEPDAAHLVALEALDSQRRRAFNRNYIIQMIVDHEQAILLFQNEARAGSDEDVQEFARQQLRTLRTHLLRAIRIAQQLGITVQEVRVR